EAPLATQAACRNQQLKSQSKPNTPSYLKIAAIQVSPVFGILLSDSKDYSEPLGCPPCHESFSSSWQYPASLRNICRADSWQSQNSCNQTHEGSGKSLRLQV